MRSPKKRSLLDVNEHFEGEHNAEITLLDTFISFMLVNSSYLMPNFALIALGIEFL